MKILARKIHKIFKDKKLRKTKVTSNFLCQLSGKDFFTFKDFQVLSEHLDTLKIHFKQVSEKDFLLTDIDPSQNVKALKISQDELDKLNEIDWSENNNIFISKQIVQKNLPRNETLLKAWIYLVALAKEGKTCSFKEFSAELELKSHLSVRPWIRTIQTFCARKGIPNLTWLVLKEASSLPHKGVGHEELINELEKMRDFNFEKYEDEFLSSFEVSVS